MSTFRTEINTAPSALLIDHQRPLLAMGSCFAAHIGQKLRERKFAILNNPFGILYNPVSIVHNLQRILRAEAYQAEELFLHRELWHSFDHHGHFALPDQAESLKKINEHLLKAKKQLDSSGTLILTLGTAYVFEHLQSQKIVANCHKLPRQDFRHYRLEVAQVIKHLATALTQLQDVAPGLQCILTVSPVRHLKDGLVENQRSKATLLLAIEKIVEEFPSAHYFPAYELQLDDLRDYRFYEADMLHPNQQAIDYIWSKFSDCHFSEKTKNLNKKIEKIIKANQHRPFHSELTGHQQFLEKQIAQITALEKEYPFLDFAEERVRFEKELI